MHHPLSEPRARFVTPWYSSWFQVKNSCIRWLPPLSLTRGILCTIFQRLVSKILMNPVFYYLRLLFFCSGHLGVSKKTYIELCTMVYNTKSGAQMPLGKSKLTDRQRDRTRHIRAHCAWAQTGSKLINRQYPAYIQKVVRNSPSCIWTGALKNLKDTYQHSLP